MERSAFVVFGVVSRSAQCGDLIHAKEYIRRCKRVYKCTLAIPSPQSVTPTATAADTIAIQHLRSIIKWTQWISARNLSVYGETTQISLDGLQNLDTSTLTDTCGTALAIIVRHHTKITEASIATKPCTNTWKHTMGVSCKGLKRNWHGKQTWRTAGRDILSCVMA